MLKEVVRPIFKSVSFGNISAIISKILKLFGKKWNGFGSGSFWRNKKNLRYKLFLINVWIKLTFNYSFNFFSSHFLETVLNFEYFSYVQDQFIHMLIQGVYK